MSDIYLSLTETPSVVTLSQPVISGALSSTVTVANTVTVALDANSLSALENVTVTVGAAVSVSNFPATQTVAGTVTANVQAGQYTTISQGQFSVGSNSGTILISDYPNGVIFSIQINTNNSTYKLQKSSALPDFGSPVDVEITDIFSGSKTTSINTLGETKTYFFKKDHTFNEGYIRLLYVSGSGSTVRFRVDAFSEGYWNQVIPVSISSVTIGSLPAISGTVTASISNFPATQAVSLTTLPALVAGTAQIGSVTASISNTVTASISGTVPISISSVTVGNSVTIGNFPATQAVSLASVPTHGVTLASTTVTVSALPRPTWTNYSGTVTTANTAITAISTTTRSYLLAQVTTGQMFINIGATATTLNSVYFSAGQGFAWETSVPQGVVSIISGVTGTNYVLKEG